MVQFEHPTGTIDGVNRVFTTSLDYASGSVVVFLNGQALTSVVVEQPPKNFEFPAECTPEPGDQIVVWYRNI